MADFKKAFLKTMQNEGGYVNNSADRGQETYKGITMANFPKWEGWSIVHAAISALRIFSTLDAGKKIWGQIDLVLAGNPELQSMVADFYKEHFWDTLSLDSEPSQVIAEEVFDTAVNMGVATAKSFIAQARRNA